MKAPAAEWLAQQRWFAGKGASGDDVVVGDPAWANASRPTS